jgi:hypothetical protein
MTIFHVLSNLPIVSAKDETPFFISKRLTGDNFSNKPGFFKGD